jgi:hypothetical protein
LLLIYRTHKAAKTALGGIAHAWRTASHVFHFAEIFFSLPTLGFAGEYNGIQKQHHRTCGKNEKTNRQYA